VPVDPGRARESRCWVAVTGSTPYARLFSPAGWWPSSTGRDASAERRARPGSAPAGPSRQETAAVTSSATRFSTSGVQVTSAKDTGHMTPSSRAAESWNSRVE
jgi:hypothetical protein